MTQHDEAERRILRVLGHHGIIPNTSGWRVALAPGGSTDRTYSAIDPSGAPMLTVRLARAGLEGRLRQEEAILRDLAAEERGWTPARISRIEDALLPEGSMLVHEHMDGLPMLVESVPDPAREAFAECLAWVHGHARPGYTIWPSPDVRLGTRAACFRDRLATLQRYESVHHGLPDAASLVSDLGALDLLASAGWYEPGFALLHGDLSSGNILWREAQVALIDWEFARDGDPAEELAYLTADQNLAPDSVAELADNYVSAGGDPWAFARMPAWLPVVALDAALWWGDYWLRQGKPAEHPDVLARLERARRYLEQ